MAGVWKAYPMRVASLRLRLLADLVDAVVVIACIAALIDVGIAGVIAYLRVRGDKAGDQDEELHSITRFLQSPQLRAALWGASAGLAVAGRNWRGPVPRGAHCSRPHYRHQSDR